MEHRHQQRTCGSTSLKLPQRTNADENVDVRKQYTEDTKCNAQHSNNESFTSRTEEELELSSHACNVCRRDELRESSKIRWADEFGFPLLETVASSFRGEESTCRILVFMMNDIITQFDFIHCEFDGDKSLLVSDLLDQLATVASRAVIQGRRFDIAFSGNVEMSHCMSLQDYQVSNGDVLFVVSRPPDCHGTKERVTRIAFKMMKDPDIAERIHFARSRKRTVHYLASSQQMERMRKRQQEARGWEI